jgi:hypothetical protein
MNVRPSVSIIKAGPRSCVPCHNCYAPHFMELFAKAAKENPAWTCYWFCCNMESGNCAGNVIRGKAMSFALRKRLPGRKDLNDQYSAANIKQVLHEYRALPPDAHGSYKFGELTARFLRLDASERQAWLHEVQKTCRRKSRGTLFVL